MRQKNILIAFLMGLTLNLSGFCADSPFDCNWSWQDNCGFVFGKDTLYWTIAQKGPAIRVETEIENATPVSTVDYTNYDWDFGWRALFGYRFGEGRGGIYAVYTSFSESANGKFREFPNVNGAPVFLESRNQVDYKTFDVLLTNDFEIDGCGNIRPLFGFRALWLDQTFETKFVGQNASGMEVEDRLIRSNYDNFAVGVHAGVEYQFTLMGKWYFYTQCAGSLLEGNIKITERLFDNIFPDGNIPTSSETREGVLVLNVDHDHCNPIGGIHLGAGLSFESCFLDCAWLRWDFGYELHHWVNISRPNADLENFQPTLHQTPSSAMTIHGVVFRGTYFF